MIRPLPSETSSTLFCDQVAAAIRERTGGRIRQLRVEQSHDRIAIAGEVGSYYLCQLALSAAQGRLRAQGASLEWQVRVVDSDSPCAQDRSENRAD